MQKNGKGFVISVERFKPHNFQAEQGEGLFISHSHEFDELTLILEGEGYYSSPDQNIKVSKGDLILIPSQLHHGFVCTEAWQGISIHFHHEKLPMYCQYLFRNIEVEPDSIRRAHLNDEELKWVEVSLLHLEKEWESNSQSLDAQQLMRVAFETALLLFQRNRSMIPSKEKTDMAIIKNVIKDIHDSYYTQITVNQIAARHFIAESTLRKKFSDYMGVTPKQYIIQLRLSEAKRLLQQTNMAIEWISSEVGFTSSSRFYDFFVKSVGITPHEWRKRNQ